MQHKEKINPVQLNNNTSSLLRSFFLNNPNQTQIKEGENFLLPEGYGIEQRNKKDLFGIPRKNQRTYGVVKGPGSRGAYGGYNKYKGKYSWCNGQLIFKKHHKKKPLGRKLIYRKNGESDQEFDNRVMREYEFVKIIAEIYGGAVPKPPLLLNSDTYSMPMPHYGKINLERFLEKVRNKSIHLSVCERLQIALFLLQIAKLFQQAGVVHRDIKPANIMIDTTAWPYRVYLIDVNLTKWSHEKDNGKYVGAPLYMSSEIFFRDSITFESDWPALAEIIAQLFNDFTLIDIADLPETKSQKELLKKRIFNRKFNKLFKEISDEELDQECKEKIKNTLELLGHWNKKNRNLDEAIAVFWEILQSKFGLDLQHPVPPSLKNISLSNRPIFSEVFLGEELPNLRLISWDVPFQKSEEVNTAVVAMMRNHTPHIVTLQFEEDNYKAMVGGITAFFKGKTNYARDSSSHTILFFSNKINKKIYFPQENKLHHLSVDIRKSNAQISFVQFNIDQKAKLYFYVCNNIEIENEEAIEKIFLDQEKIKEGPIIVVGNFSPFNVSNNDEKNLAQRVVVFEKTTGKKIENPVRVIHPRTGFKFSIPTVQSTQDNENKEKKRILM